MNPIISFILKYAWFDIVLSSLLLMTGYTLSPLYFAAAVLALNLATYIPGLNFFNFLKAEHALLYIGFAIIFDFMMPNPLLSVALMPFITTATIKVITWLLPAQHPARLRMQAFGMIDNEHAIGVDDVDDQALRNVAQRGVYQPLTRAQANTLNVMREKYKDVLRQRTRDAVMAEIKAAMIASYNATPAKLNDQNLPIEYNAALANQEPYYAHAVHGAYRYLFLRPNPWIGGGGLAVRVGNGFAADISEQNYNDIAYMWLMANDENQAIPEGYDREALKFEFFNALSDLNRAHNRGNGRDNKLPDSPTCPPGILQRTTQYLMVFLNEKPELRPLSNNVIQTRFKEALINESAKKNGIYAKLQKMTRPELKEVYSALKAVNLKHLGKWDKLSKAQKKQLNKLKLSQAELDQFIQETKVAFTPKRITDKHPEQIRYQDHKFETFEAFIKHLAKPDVTLMQFHDDIARNMKQLFPKAAKVQAPAMDKPNKLLRFTQENKENQRADANKDHQEKRRKKHVI